MDESALERMLREAPLPAFRDGHESRFGARCRSRCDAGLGPRLDTQLDARVDALVETGLDAASDAHPGPRAMRVDGHHRRARWIAAAAVVVLAGITSVLIVRGRAGESATARITTVPVYWSRPVEAVRLDIRRWSCDGCTQGGGTGSRIRHRPRGRKGRNQ
jgi:hypothetical protein